MNVNMRIKLKVAALPVAVTQSGKKGRRGAKDAIEKAVNAKKQKVEQDEAVIAKQKSDKKKPKKVESRSEEDSSIFHSDEDPKAGLKKSQPIKNKKPAPTLAKKTKESSDIESDSDGSDEEPPPKKQPIAVVKNDSKKESSSSDESSNDSSDEEEETKPRVKACATALKNGSLVVKKKSSDDDSGESEDEKLRSTLESFADQRVAYTYMLDSSQFGKLKRCGTIGGKDRISGLPDAILSHVLNYLTLKEAIATSILSRRWENLWTWRPNLDFGCLPQTNWDTYIQIVNHILKQHKAPTLHKLRIVYPLLDSHGHHVDDWISFALRKGVSELSFDYFSFVGHPQNYHVHAHVFGGGRTRNSNTVDCASLHTTLHNGRIHFETLTQLCLRSVNLSDEVFDLILSNCIYLERFLLMCTLGLVNAKCTTPNLKLKSLELYHCKHLEYLQLSAPNLMSFKYEGRQRTLCIKDAKHLASLSSLIYISPDPNTSSIFPRGKSFIFSQFSSYLPKLESLVVSVNQFYDMIDFTELNAFSNLKQLKLFVYPHSIQQSYRVAASIIRAAPYLELLEIILPTMARRLLSYEALELTSMPPHQNFKEFKLYGFGGDDNTMKFLAYLVEYAVSLQKIDITALGAILCGDELIVQPLLDRNRDHAEHSKNCMFQLRQTLHSNVQLVFHDG